MQKISYDDKSLARWISGDMKTAFNNEIALAEKMLNEKTGLGNDFLGWLDLPSELSADFLGGIQDKANKIREKCDLFIAIGIGGSYLGSKAAIEFLSTTFESARKPQVLFAGHTVNSDYLADLIDLMEGKDVVLNIISKSGTTTEPGITFRVLRQWMEAKYGKEEAAKRIVATTDPENGALRQLTNEQGYDSFDIPANVGGRFSVLTPVGLLPIAVAGIDIKELVEGAREAMGFCSGDTVETNMAAQYAVVRNILFREGKTTEVLAGFQPQIHFINEWWKQLYGESEGKNRTGIFPAAVDYTTDLHSMGQWMQEGVRNVFETFVVVKNTNRTVTIPNVGDNGDGLDYLVDKSFEYVNENAYKGTLLAHLDGDVPAATITLEDRSAATLGQLFYFFEKACAISGYLLRVNPFNQPGVEAYKKNMFALLNKPGFEELSAEIAERMKTIQ